MKETLLLEAISLSIYGMGTVFVFLCLLIFLTSSMSKLSLFLKLDNATEEDDLTLERVAKEAAVKFHNRNK